MDQQELFRRLAVALAIGLLIGLEPRLADS
jgi:hypothetical protein